jgi:hypothetical protein
MLPQQAIISGPRYEYKFARPGFALGDEGVFNKLGAEGWEYLGLSPHDDKRYIFRRAVA